MKCLIVLALATVAHTTTEVGYSRYYVNPVITPDGFLADTPEVAAAKASHYAAHARALGTPSYYQYYPAPASTYTRYVTPSYYNYPSTRYLGPLAYPTVLPSGYLADTPDVQAAKAEHFQEYARALTRSSY